MYFQTFKKSAKEIDSTLKDLTDQELKEACWKRLSAEDFNIVGNYVMDLQVSVFDQLKIKRGNLNQLNSCTLLERLPNHIPVSI